MAAMVSAHFSESELGAVGAPVAVRENLARLAALLEAVRAAVGVPLRVTSGYRAPAHNAEVAGSSKTSQHMTGAAADIAPVGLSMREFYELFTAAERAGKIPAYSQVIFYPFTTGHVHIGLPIAGRTPRERLVKLGETGYAQISADLVMRFPGAAAAAQIAAKAKDAASAAPGFLLVLLGVALFWFMLHLRQELMG